MKCQHHQCTDNLVLEDTLSCIECNKAFHFFCAGTSHKIFNKMTEETKLKWKCAQCKGKRTYLLRDKEVSTATTRSTTPIQALAPTSPGTQQLGSPRKSELSMVLDEIKSLRSELQLVQSKIDTLETNMTFYSDSIDEIKNSMNEIGLKIKKIDQVEEDVRKLKFESIKQKASENERDQWDRSSNIEINGIPRLPNEDLYAITEKIMSSAGIDPNQYDLDYAYRVIPRIDQSGVGESERRAPSIVVRFTTRRRKEHVMERLRERRAAGARPLTLQQLGIESGARGASSVVYVGDHLTRQEM